MIMIMRTRLGPNEEVGDVNAYLIDKKGLIAYLKALERKLEQRRMSSSGDDCWLKRRYEALNDFPE